MTPNQRPTILYIETATEVCSVALAQGNKLLTCCDICEDNAHAKIVMLLVDKVLKEAGLETSQLQAVALSNGPGSYTGLRIGASTAKGLCYALQIPLIAISTLQSIAMGATAEFQGETEVVVPMIDARRMEVYTALCDAKGDFTTEIQNLIIDESSYIELLQTKKVLFCGNGATKIRPLYQQYPNAQFSEVPLSAKNMIPAALSRFQQSEFEDVAYMEPFYLKNFVAAPPKVKGLI
ncbi:MAG: tRNA (adenosine(37)-N6)-threonylcarbamoyltransferase complex dimerization subunit type 1 TsaB [Bacteroidales bacterium]|jgi:tRNA threonylcarbamoyladenosine biosynthesis protein TsaB|nr:tRNA (adenosine(37)-N6)-threonylcarbamoyltransferase complex dimerization subunit type 1 TsaB [Bacteroidales bacterium]